MHKIARQTLSNGSTTRVVQADLTPLPVGGVLHAANPALRGGFTGISTGLSGDPVSEAAPLAVRRVRDLLMEHRSPAQGVFCTVEPESTRTCRQVLEPSRSSPD